MSPSTVPVVSHFGYRGVDAVEGVGADFAGVLRKLVLDDPLQEAGVAGDEVFDFLAFLLAEVDGELAILPAETSRAVGTEWIGGVEHTIERIHVAGEVGIHFELALDDFPCGEYIGFGTVGIDVFFAAVEFERSTEGAGFSGVEDLLGIEYTASVYAELDAGTGELFNQNWNIKACGIVAGEIVVSSKEKLDFQCDHFKRRAVLDVVVGDAVDFGSFFWDGHAGINKPALGGARAVGLNAQRGELDNTVGADAGAGGFNVENNEGAVEFNGEHDVFQGRCEGGIYRSTLRIVCFNSGALSG